jgi:WD40 repeat protein
MTGSSSTVVATTNPFVGPHPIDTGRKIFGRDREIEELYYLLSAGRIVLLHSPSGAGKSSLVQAGLVPRLAELFDVWGPTRVNLLPPEGELASMNRYVRSANLGFEARIPKERQRLPELISAMALSEYVAGRPRRRSAPSNIVLLFDQFEEILTVDALALQAKHNFFDQLGKLLQDPHIWALFALREDYLAPLDPYAEQVPTHLKNRFRLDLLARDSALEAISRSVEEGGRRFAPEAVNKLVNDLATMQVQRPDGTFESRTGPFVEPLYLQVACRGLWERMPAEKLTIDLDDTQSFGDVTKALAEYYEREVVGIAGSDPRVERAIREWMGEALITADGIRGQVLKGAGQSDGLDNQLIDKLVDAHLVRAEQRAGAWWYELSHDRLIEPVRTSNKAWFETHLSNLQKVATVWEGQGSPEGLLLLDAELVEAKQWAAKNESSLTGTERKFLEASGTKQESIRREKRQTLRLRLALGVVIALFVTVLISLWRAHESARLANQQKIAETATDAMSDLVDHLDDDRSALLARQSLALQKSTSSEPQIVVERALQSAIDSEKFAHVLSGFEGPVYSVVFSPDGMLLASGSSGKISVRDLRTPNALPILIPGWIFAFAPDGNRLASINDTTVRLWDLRQPNAKPLELSGHPDGGFSIAFSPDGNRLASSAGKTVLLWDLQQPDAQPAQLSGHTGKIYSVAFSPDGKSLASSSVDKTILLWDLQQPNASPRVLPGNQGQVYSVAFAPDGHHLAGACYDGVVRLWDVLQPNAAPVELSSPGGRVMSVAFSPDGNHIASAHWDGGVRVWDWQNLSRLPLVLTGHNGIVNWVAFSHDGKRLASASDDKTVRVWDDLERASGPLKILAGHQGEVVSVAFSPDGQNLASASIDKSVRLWKLRQPDTPPVVFSDNEGSLSSVAFSHDGTRLAAGGDDRVLRVWDPKQPNKPLFEFAGHQGRIWSVAFAPDGHRLASASQDTTVRIWNLNQPSQPPAVLSYKGAQFQSVTFSPDGARIAASSYTARAAFVWDLRERSKPPRRFYSDGMEDASWVAFSPDGNRLAEADSDRKVRVWNLNTNENPLVLYGHQAWVYSVTFSPDGNLLASASEDHTVRVWDLRQTHQPPIVIPGNHGAIHSVAFSPDGNLLAFANADGTVGLWPLWDNAADYLCTVVWRNLSWDEWQSYIGKDLPYERTCKNLPDGEGVPSEQNANDASSSRQVRR